MFEKYTFPSVEGQTLQNFIWLVLFSASTPDIFKERIAHYQRAMNNFVPLYIKDEEAADFRKIIIEYIRKTSEDTDTIVTTRCDNDDALSKYFIEEIQRNVCGDSEYIISFPNGYQYDEKTQIIRKYYFPTSHFTTFVSQKKERSIYDFLHMEIMDQCRVRLIEHSPLWVEIIHEQNVYNCMGTIRFSDYVREYDLGEEFNISLKAKQKPIYLFAMYVYFAIHKLYVKRHRIVAALKRKMKGK